MHLRYIFVGTVLVFFVPAALGQIVDDSTQLVYGPSTVNVVYEHFLKLNLSETAAIDTSLTDFEKFSYVDRSGHNYRNLGNIGTAMFSTFYEMPEIIGRTPGYNAYNIYNVDPKTFKYYDTKSPFMDLSVVLGGQGRTVIDYTFSQNVNPNWNIGFDIHKLNIDKQIGAEQNEGDRNVENTRYDLYTFYDHPEVPYRLMAYISSFSHKVDETGGIAVSDSASNAEIFQYRDSQIKLEDVQGIERRTDLHIYQEYGLFKEFQLYHQLDRNTQVNIYKDYVDGSASSGNDTYVSFYPRFLIDPDSTYQESRFTSFSNEIGLKGSVSSVYYRFYLRNRLVDNEFLYLDSFEPASENYLGGVSQFTWRDLFAIRAEGEILQSGEFKLSGFLNSDFLNASYKTIRYRQPNLVQDYFGNHHEWHNDFDKGFANELAGSLNFNWKGVNLVPGLQLRTLDNFVYYDTLSSPKIATAPVLISKIGGQVNFFFNTNRELGEGFHFRNEGYFTTVTGNSAEVIRVPQFFYNGKVYWDGAWFEKAVPLQVGFNVHAKSAYKANAYNPAIQQYYLQDDTELSSYWTLDVFANMRIDKIFVFVKVTYANMAAESGYFVAPDYTGQERIFDFGVRWLFFD